MSVRIVLATVSALLLPAGIARADADLNDHEPTTSPVEEAASDSSFTPTMVRADNPGRAFLLAATTYNGASKKGTLDANGEVNVYGPLHLVLRVDDITRTARPGIGAGYQFLFENRHGVSSTAYLVYKTEGFTEIEGEVEAAISFARKLGPLRGLVNVAYGQDPEGNERDGELALALNTEVTSRVFAGVVGKYRDALGSHGDKSTGELRDMFGGVAGTVVVGPIGITAMAGFAGVKTYNTTTSSANPTVFGPSATLGVGTAF